MIITTFLLVLPIAILTALAINKVNQGMSGYTTINWGAISEALSCLRYFTICGKCKTRIPGLRRIVSLGAKNLDNYMERTSL
jgi:hypothetical protein